jgi:branched-chain amino acid transport system ATP-binding protein
MLKIDELTISYGRIAAVRGLSLEVREGETVALLGANGAGKSTVLATIAGAHRPSDGDILLDGHSIIDLKPEEIARRGVSLVPEGRGLFEALTVEDNLRLGLTARRSRSSRRDGPSKTDFESVMSLFSALPPLFRTPAGKLSGGEQQQLAIARALVSDPRILLLDEPTLGLAPMVIDRLFETLNKLRQEGVTILLAEQKVRRVRELADRTYVMKTGRLIKEVSGKTATDAKDLEQFYLGV